MHPKIARGRALRGRSSASALLALVMGAPRFRQKSYMAPGGLSQTAGSGGAIHI
ncbi:hypothetical protein TUZN_1622 [Thermoproteus uzoniensis 768-20]|uniref:Uncharacterized protein n=1 Tax=Thermoproteus uzoniensis (strain 768-20) TaxID=999630 RepID=F2L2P1_THEU7|nr:hypothetical protein TUZN_1622 [Thermoproteus uzoniensis 768-20]